MSHFKDISNQKFGRLMAINSTKERKHGSVVWICICSCGKKVSVSSSNLKTGSTKSCDCIRHELLKSGRLRRTYGMRRHPLYWVWTTMKRRCLNPKGKKYHRYGGRGIMVCPEWLKFENFYKDMAIGYNRGLQIDRIDNNGNYCKENCRWTTSKINNNNRYY